MFEIEKSTIGQSPLHELFSTDKLDTEQEKSLHDDVVLKMQICLRYVLLSRRMKGIEKKAIIILAFISLKIQNKTNRKGISLIITVTR